MNLTSSATPFEFRPRRYPRSSLLKRRVDEHPTVAFVDDATLFVRAALSKQLIHFLIRQGLPFPRQDFLELRARDVWPAVMAVLGVSPLTLLSILCRFPFAPR